jgi:HSF-type DNA-binding
MLWQLMLLMLHVEKESFPLNGQTIPKEDWSLVADWCTRDTGEDSDHVIVIYDSDRFVKILLPLFQFPVTTLASFVRKLFRWGFRQVSERYEIANKKQFNKPRSTYMFECEHFRKGDFPLLHMMKSKVPSGKREEISLSSPDSTDASVDISTPTENNDQETASLQPAMQGRKRSATKLSSSADPIRRDKKPKKNRPASSRAASTWNDCDLAAPTDFHHLRTNRAMQDALPSVLPAPATKYDAEDHLVARGHSSAEAKQIMDLQVANEAIRLRNESLANSIRLMSQTDTEPGITSFGRYSRGADGRVAAIGADLVDLSSVERRSPRMDVGFALPPAEVHHLPYPAGFNPVLLYDGSWNQFIDSSRREFHGAAQGLCRGPYSSGGGADANSFHFRVQGTQATVPPSRSLQEALASRNQYIESLAGNRMPPQGLSGNAATVLVQNRGFGGNLDVGHALLGAAAPFNPSTGSLLQQLSASATQLLLLQRQQEIDQAASRSVSIGLANLRSDAVSSLLLHRRDGDQQPSTTTIQRRSDLDPHPHWYFNRPT